MNGNYKDKNNILIKFYKNINKIYNSILHNLFILLIILIIIISLFLCIIIYEFQLLNNKFNCKFDNTYNIHLPILLYKKNFFNVKGKIECSKIIKQIYITIIDKDQFNVENKVSYNLFSNLIYLDKYNNKILFEQLLPGEKIFNITIIDIKNNIFTIIKNFTILGMAKEPLHMTNYCKIYSSGSKFQINSIINSFNNLQNSFNNGTIIIKIPNSKKIDGLYLKFFHSKNNYTIESYSKYRILLNYYDSSGYPMLHKYFKLNEDTKEIIIKLDGNPKYKGITSLRIYEKNKVGISVQQWKSPDKCNLMLISAHRDDELLFFGGNIPYYLFVKNKKVCTVFMSGTDIIRMREALSSQWSIGVKNYPIFMGFKGGFHNGINGTLKDWGGEEYVISKIVEIIRKYKPEVIVTHDIKGEYGHPSHKTTSYLVQKAINLTSNKNLFIESYYNYGIHQVQKLYLHLYKENEIIMNWDLRLPSLDYRTPFEVACIGYDKYYSQHKLFRMSGRFAKKYNNSKYGLKYSNVGKDIKKNDFFENIK